MWPINTTDHSLENLLEIKKYGKRNKPYLGLKIAPVRQDWTVKWTYKETNTIEKEQNMLCPRWIKENNEQQKWSYWSMSKSGWNLYRKAHIWTLKGGVQMMPGRDGAWTPPKRLDFVAVLSNKTTSLGWAVPSSDQLELAINKLLVPSLCWGSHFITCNCLLIAR